MFVCSITGAETLILAFMQNILALVDTLDDREIKIIFTENHSAAIKPEDEELLFKFPVNVPAIQTVTSSLSWLYSLNIYIFIYLFIFCLQTFYHLISQQQSSTLEINEYTTQHN